MSIKWAILGTSFISEVMAEAIHTSVLAELYAVGSRSIETAKMFADKFSIPNAYNYQEILSDPAIDAVYIGLPNHLHKEWIIKCAEAGKHVLVEKPFVLNLPEIRETWEAVKEAQIHCMEALMYKYHPLTQKLISLVESNVIGEMKLINAVYTADIATKANPIAGGAIRNLGCYPVSLIRLLTGAEPEDMQNMLATGRKNSKTKHDHQASMLLRYANDMVAVISTADDLPMHWQFDIYGTKGRIQVVTNPWLPTQEKNEIWLHANGKIKKIKVKADKPLYTYQIDVLSNQILNPVEGFTQQAMLDSFANVAILQSWYEIYNFSQLPDSITVS